jgi:transposase-like protein
MPLSKDIAARKRKSFSFDFKLRAVVKAEVVGNREAAKAFNVDEHCIRHWRKLKTTIVEAIESDSKNKQRKKVNPLLIFCDKI